MSALAESSAISLSVSLSSIDYCACSIVDDREWVSPVGRGDQRDSAQNMQAKEQGGPCPSKSLRPSDPRVRSLASAMFAP